MAQNLFRISIEQAAEFKADHKLVDNLAAKFKALLENHSHQKRTSTNGEAEEYLFTIDWDFYAFVANNPAYIRITEIALQGNDWVILKSEVSFKK